MKIIIYIFAVSCFCILPSCEKYLEEKSDQRLATPDTIDDLWAILNGGDLRIAMTETNVTTDEFYVEPSFWPLFGPKDQYGYIWNAEADYGINSYDWSIQYRTIFYVNSVLDNLERVSPNGQEQEWNSIKGTALFIRSYTFYQLAQVYAKQYDPNTANSDLGIVLRLSSDFNKRSVRSTVQETYDNIIADLLSAVDLLPVTPAYRVRPGKPAAFALLARIYLTMGDYVNSKKYADDCLNLYSKLLDFTLLDTSSLNPIPPLNEEVLYYTQTNATLNAFPYPLVMVDSTLAKSYDANDLRRAIYLNQNPDGTFSYKTISNNGDFIYNGISVDEVYLIRAESYARLSNTADAMDDLNTLLERRWKTGSFTPYVAASADAALNLILQERKKELLNRGTRWTDLRRLNKEPNFAITLKRVIGADTYTITPNDPRYVWLIPQEIIDIAKIQQNPR